MAGPVFWVLVFGILSSLHTLVETESEEIQKIQMPDKDDVSFYGSMRLIMRPKNGYVPCHFELKVCGIIMCASKSKHYSEDVKSGSQISIRDTNYKQVLYEDKLCFCNNNEVDLFLTQEGMEVEDKPFLEYRVREVTDDDCKAEVCYWKLIVITRITNEFGRKLDVTGCINNNICMVACHVRNSTLLQGAYDFTLLEMIVVTSVVSVVLTVILKNCTGTGRAFCKVPGRDIGTQTPQQSQYLPSSSESNTDNSEDISTDEETEGVDENSPPVRYRTIREIRSALDEVDIMTYEAFEEHLLMRERSPEKEPDHLRYRLRL